MIFKLNSVLVVLAVVASSPSSSAFVQPRSSSFSPIEITTQLMASTSSTQTKPRPPKRTLQDRTPEEATNLLRDTIRAAYDAGPRAAPARTLQAYIAMAQTIRDFSPILQTNAPEKFTFPVAMRKLFERLGATYVKLGQFIASSPSLFPEEYVLEFQKCLDSTEPVPWIIIKEIIETELGPINTNFAYVDTKPLASASIAQVHAATLISGQEIVIKVQKPKIDELLRADLNFVYIASRIIEFISPDFERTSLSAVAGDVKSSMLDELDFTKEAGNIEEFRTFLVERGLDDSVTAPKVYKDLTTTRVLTMERLRGVSMTDAD